MLDTSDEIAKKQQEILNSKSAAERFAIGAELIDFGFKMVENSIRQDSPDISPSKLRIEMVKRCYSQVFSEKEINEIFEGIKNYYLNVKH